MTRNAKLLTYQGRTMSLIEWSRDTGINYRTILQRVKAGWPSDEVVTVRTVRAP